MASTVTTEDESRVSVCVLSKDPGKVLAKCLEGIANQTRRADEVLVVDDASSDEAIEGTFRVHHARLVRHDRPKGRAATRNLALANARFALVAMIDADCVPDAKWLSELVACMESSTVFCAIGATVPVTTRLRGPAPVTEPIPHTPISIRGWSAAFLSVTNAVYRRRAAMSAGWFDTVYTDGGEELEMSRRLEGTGYATVLCPSATVCSTRGESTLASRRRYLRTLFPVLGLGSTTALAWRAFNATIRRRGGVALDQITWFLYARPVWDWDRSVAQAYDELCSSMERAGGRWNSRGLPRPLAWLVSLNVMAKQVEVQLAFQLLKLLDVVVGTRLIRRYSARNGPAKFPPSRSVSISQTSPIRLSACIMTMNQEALLPIPLTSLKSWVDELLVVDGGSTDRSVEVAKDYGARVISNPWPGQNYLQRNVYLKHARGDWLLVLDSDEFVDESAPEVIHRLIRSTSQSHFWLPRRWLLCRDGTLAYLKDVGVFPDYQRRLFRNLPGATYTGVIHERLHGFGLVLNWVSDVPIYHLDFVLNNRDSRAAKVASYERANRGSGHPRFYLFEDYDYIVQPVPVASMPILVQKLLKSRHPGACFEGPARP